MEKAIMCPQCNAPLAPHRFARSVVCSYCGATVQLDEASVSAELFRQSYLAWNSPATYSISAGISIGDSHWALDRFLARGEISDVYAARRARWPTERAVLKISRDKENAGLLKNEWEVLHKLQDSPARGVENFITLIPQPILLGVITEGAHAGQLCSVYRWTHGFRYTFEAVQKAYPQGVPPRASIWMWRRILEVLSFLHASGLVHGAILPPNLLIQDHDHGVRLIGFSRTGPVGQELHHIPTGFEAFYPQPVKGNVTLGVELDLLMSARCIAAALGGDPEATNIYPAVPGPLANLIRKMAQGDFSRPVAEDAWSVRTKLGQIADEVYGAPEFIPIEMPD